VQEPDFMAHPLYIPFSMLLVFNEKPAKKYFLTLSNALNFEKTEVYRQAIIENLKIMEHVEFLGNPEEYT
jgi:hypothetical protein